MSKTEEKNVAAVLNIFRTEKVMTLKQLAELLNCCERTGQRRLKQWRTYTSYNQNGRYYVLPDIPRFDQNGLWRYKGIFFSRYGNLRQAVIHIVNHSQAGLTAKEIEEIMRLSPNSFRSYFRNMQDLYCEKLGSQYVYFSSDKAVLSKQEQKRQEYNERVKLINLPRDAEAVIILVERIKHPQLSIDRLAAKLTRKGHPIRAEVIENLFERHDLVKKTVNTQR